jgi:SOS-response transcriptional repressor LexA
MLFPEVKSAARCQSDSNANNGGMTERPNRQAVRPVADALAAEAAALKKAFEERTPALSQERFGLEFDIGSQGMVWQYLSGHRPLNLSVALKFARGLGIPVSQFSRRLADELRAAGVTTDAFSVNESVGILRANQIPVVGTARGGDDAFYVEIDYPVGAGDGYVSYPTKRSNAYAIRVRGDSMRPRIKPGEYVIIEPDVPCLPGDEVVVKTKSGKTMVKVLHSERKGFIELLSLNDDHKPITIEISDIEFMHHVAGIAKDVLYRHDREP